MINEMIQHQIELIEKSIYTTPTTNLKERYNGSTRVGGQREYEAVEIRYQGCTVYLFPDGSWRAVRA